MSGSRTAAPRGSGNDNLRGHIPETDIAKVRAATSIRELFEAETTLKRVGNRWMAVCPFHAEQTGSCSVDEERGLYYCFGCNASGDAITFVVQRQGLSFADAVIYLADRAGITIDLDESPEDKEKRLRTKRLGDAVDKASGWYHEQLLGSPSAREARDYLKGRGLDSETAKRFRIGWAPGGDGAVGALHLSSDVARESGVAARTDGRTYDLLRQRIVFTIFDVQGNVVALAGRKLPEADGPKYVNFAETPLYRKRQVLYGLNWARRAAAGSNEIVVCEGYTDVIACHLAGVENAIATCGVALTEDHVKLLARFAKRIVAAYDADAAGEGGIDRMYPWQAKYGVQFYVASFPEGEDPASLREKGRVDELRNAIANAQPILGWQIDRLFASASLTTPEGRIVAADQAIELAKSHPDARVRAQYADVIAARTKIDINDVRRRLGGPSTAARHPRPAHPAPPARSNLGGPEYEALRLALLDPPAAAGWINPALFYDDLARRCLLAMLAYPTEAEVLAAADDDVRALLTRFLAEGEKSSDPDEVHRLLVFGAAKREMGRLVAESSQPGSDFARISRTQAQISALAASAREEGAPEVLSELEKLLLAVIPEPDETMGAVAPEVSPPAQIEPVADDAPIVERYDDEDEDDRPTPEDLGFALGETPIANTETTDPDNSWDI